MDSLNPHKESDTLQPGSLTWEKPMRKQRIEDIEYNFPIGTKMLLNIVPLPKEYYGEKYKYPTGFKVTDINALFT